MSLEGIRKNQQREDAGLAESSSRQTRSARRRAQATQMQALEEATIQANEVSSGRCNRRTAPHCQTPQSQDPTVVESKTLHERIANRRAHAAQRQAEMHANELPSVNHKRNTPRRSRTLEPDANTCPVQTNSLQRRRAARAAYAAARQSPQEAEIQENEHSNTLQQRTRGRRGKGHEPQVTHTPGKIVPVCSLATATNS